MAKLVLNMEKNNASSAENLAQYLKILNSMEKAEMKGFLDGYFQACDMKKPKEVKDKA
jgi:hypothetical protein